MASHKKKASASAEVPASPAPVEATEVEHVIPFQRAPKLSSRAIAALVAAVVVINLPIIHYFLFRQPPKAEVALPYREDFSNSSVVEKNFFTTGGHWRVVDGWLLSPGVKNNPLWLKASLPQDVAVEFDVRSESPEGDIKVEIFGDGTDHASGYVLIHGAWSNTLSVICRLDEHGENVTQIAQRYGVQASDARGLLAAGAFNAKTRMRVEANPFPVTMSRSYHWRIERRGSEIRWSIDGQPFMSFDDPLPLVGKKHDRFAFSSWEAPLYFDNLSIQPL